MRIAVASQKGGAGKTTSSISLAAGLGRRGSKVLLIDIDSQANSSEALLPHYQQIPIEQTLYVTVLQREPLAVHQTQIPGLDIVPSHILLSNTDIELTTARDHQEARLETQLEVVQDDYDHEILDCPPALSWLTVNAVTAAEATTVTITPAIWCYVDRIPEQIDQVIHIKGKSDGGAQAPQGDRKHLLWDSPEVPAGSHRKRRTLLLSDGSRTRM